MGWEDDDEVVTTFGTIQLFRSQVTIEERERILGFIRELTCDACENEEHEICRWNRALMTFIEVGA